MEYRYCGRSGIQLPLLSLGLWHNFGEADDFSISKDMILTAFDKGICHFDLANNYGPPPGAAEICFGKILRSYLSTHRDKLFIASKAAHRMWDGVYGDGGSRKNIIASCNQSLKRTGLDYFDVFYCHRYDGITPIEESMQALVDLVHQGKTLYVGISKFPPREQQIAYDYLKAANVPCLMSQYRCSMFDLKASKTNFDIAVNNGSGIICFSPLAQGLLSGKYNNGIPAESRAAKPTGFLQTTQITPERIAATRQLEKIAQSRGQSLSQMALAWVLNDQRVSSVILGTSSVSQLEDNIRTIYNLRFCEEELKQIENIINNENLSF